MKKSLSLHIVIILFLPTLIFSQVDLGFIGGVNNTSLSGDNPPNASFSSGYGYHLGVQSDFYILDDVAINFQPMYTTYSTFLSYDVNYQYEKYDSLKTSSDYLEFPLSIKVVSDNEISYVTAGFSVGYFLSSKTKNQTTDKKIDSDDRYSQYNLRAHFGVGAQFDLGIPILFFEIRYSQSLTNIIDGKIFELNINRKLKSNGFRLFTGLMFRL